MEEGERKQNGKTGGGGVVGCLITRPFYSCITIVVYEFGDSKRSWFCFRL